MKNVSAVGTGDQRASDLPEGVSQDSGPAKFYAGVWPSVTRCPSFIYSFFKRNQQTRFQYNISVLLMLALNLFRYHAILTKHTHGIRLDDLSSGPQDLRS